MPISASTLSALQKVGAAAFNADDKLKKEIGLYAQRVNTAIFNNPYSLGNDALIESWKVVARLSRTLSGIEEELRNIYRIANELAEDDQPSVREARILAAPAPSDKKKPVKKSTTKAVDLTATTVKVKKVVKKHPTKVITASATPTAKSKQSAGTPQTGKRATTPTAQPTKPVKKAPVTKAKAGVAAPAKTSAKDAKVIATSAVVAPQKLKGNPAKLLTHLLTTLKTEAFEHLNQTVLAKETGIPLGSIGATLDRLTRAGRLVAGPLRSYKLTSVQVKAVTEKPAPVVQPEDQATAAAEPKA